MESTKKRRQRYSFGIIGRDETGEVQKVVDNLVQKNQLNKTLNKLLRLYAASEELQQLVDDIDYYEQLNREQALRDIVQNSSIYERLGIKNPKPEPEPEPEAQGMTLEDLAAQLQKMQSKMESLTRQQDTRPYTPARVWEEMEEEKEEKPFTFEDPDADTDAGDDFDSCFGDFIM